MHKWKSMILDPGTDFCPSMTGQMELRPMFSIAQSYLLPHQSKMYFCWQDYWMSWMPGKFPGRCACNLICDIFWVTLHLSTHANNMITIVVEVIEICFFFITTRVEADMKICLWNAKAKHVNIPFICPSVFFEKNTILEDNKNFQQLCSHMQLLHSSFHPQQYVICHEWYWDNCLNILLSSLMSFVHRYYPIIWVPYEDETIVWIIIMLCIHLLVKVQILLISNKVIDTSWLVDCDINGLTSLGHRHFSLVPIQLVFSTE